MLSLFMSVIFNENATNAFMGEYSNGRNNSLILGQKFYRTSASLNNALKFCNQPGARNSLAGVPISETDVLSFDCLYFHTKDLIFKALFYLIAKKLA